MAPRTAAFTVAAAEPPAPVRQIGDEVTAVRRSTDIVPFALLKNEERMPRGTQAEPPPGASLCPPVCLHHLSGPHGQARLSGSRRALPPASDEPGSGGHSPPGHCPSGTTGGRTQPRRPRCPGPGAGPAREHSRAAFSTKRIPALSRGDGQQNRWLCQRGQCDRCDRCDGAGGKTPRKVPLTETT